MLRKKDEEKKNLKIKRDGGGVTDRKNIYISRLRYGRWRGVKQADTREASETEN